MTYIEKITQQIMEKHKAGEDLEVFRLKALRAKVIIKMIIKDEGYIAPVSYMSGEAERFHIIQGGVDGIE